MGKVTYPPKLIGNTTISGSLEVQGDLDMKEQDILKVGTIKAKNFSARSPQMKGFQEALESIKSYEGGSGEISQLLADAIKVIKKQREEIEKIKKKLGQLEDEVK